MVDRAAQPPRALLRRLREVMAAPQTGQARLDRIVRLIASDMVAEVCSIYMLCEADTLELFATEGLNPSAVHATRLRFGEGLIGDIARHARPLNLSEAQASPLFAYKPETGEDPYQSLVGVPIIRDGRVLGVLAVQNRARRTYDEEEVEALETVAMVVAEMASGDLIDLESIEAGDPQRRGPATVSGLALADGLAVGTAVRHEAKVSVERLFAEDVGVERKRLEDAIVSLRGSVDDLVARSDLDVLEPEHVEVLKAYRMFAYDKAWVRRMVEAVQQGLSAEAAVERVHNESRARMLRQTDPYLRERLHDLDDLANRLIRHLTGAKTAAAQELPEQTIVVARSMGPADLLDYDRTRLRGVLIEEGSATSHVAILARALALPMVGRLGDIADKVRTGDTVIVDGVMGEAHLRPQPEVLAAYEAKIALRRARLAEFDTVRNLPAVTRDGVAIRLMMNAGLTFDLPNLAETNADGIGLFRTELQYMVGDAMPRLRAQTDLYRQALDTAGDRPVVFRTLDLGGDKILPYGKQIREENPALGWRAIRMALDRPALLRYQIRALLKAADDRPLWIMFPMVSEPAELDRCRAILDRELAHHRRHTGREPPPLHVGAMLEVPSLAWSIRALRGRVDFLSVGSNDLMQFHFASDRGNPRLAHRYDTLSVPALRFLRFIVEEANAAGVPLSLCGEMAGRPVEALMLIALGFRTLSMPPGDIGPMKLMVRSLDAGKAASELLPLLDKSGGSLRAGIESFAEATDVLV